MLIVDRIEENFAVIESDDDTFKDGMIDIELSKLPKNISEGDVIRLNSSGEYEIDEAETNKLREEIKKLEDELFR